VLSLFEPPSHLQNLAYALELADVVRLRIEAARDNLKAVIQMICFVNLSSKRVVKLDLTLVKLQVEDC
jgi:hypothetical protein